MLISKFYTIKRLASAYATKPFQMPHFEVVINGIIKGGVHRLLNLADLKEVEIPVPDIDEVIKFRNIKNNIESIISISNKLDSLPLFDALSQRAFSGRL